MEQKVCLDSDVLINFLRGDEKTLHQLESVEGEFYSTSINFFELWGGRSSNEPLSELFSKIHIRDFDRESAAIAGDIRKELKKRGKDVEFRDIFIASICIRHGLDLMTLNRKHFERMKDFGLKLKSP